MTILDGLRPPPVPRDEKLEQLIEATGQRVSMLDIDELARLGAHEYDEETVVPPPGSPGEQFLREVARGFVRWISVNGRFPGDAEAAEVAEVWHRDTAPDVPVPGSAVAQAYVDLGLFYSAHAAAAVRADVPGLQAVLDEVAVQIIVTLTEDHAPLV